VNSREHFYWTDDVGYRDTPTLDDDIDEILQEEELLASFVVKPGAGLNNLVTDADDIQMLVKWKCKSIKEKVWLSNLRTRLPNRNVDEFWDGDVQVLFLFTSSFISYIFLLIIILTAYSLKQDVKMSG
jgi:hypothetical protein